MTTKTKTCNVSKPKSVNSKKSSNNKSDIKFLKELNGQVVVSVEQYKAHTDLFLGNIWDGLSLKDNRDVVVAIATGGMVFPIERVAELLLNCIFINYEMISENVNSELTVQAYPIIARAYNLYCAIMDVMLPGHKPATLEVIRQQDEDLYRLLKVDGTVKYFDKVSRDYEKPENPKFRFGNERIDTEYLAYMILNGILGMQRMWQENTDVTEDRKDFMFTLCMGSIMVTKLRRMERMAAIKYAANVLGPGSKSCVEVVSRMLTIGKEAA